MSITTAGSTSIPRLSISKLLTIGTCISVAALLVFAATSFWVMSRIKVNGPIYRDIVRDKDMIADVLPPPEYVIESYLVAHQAAAAGSRGDAAALVQFKERFKKLRAEYDDRHAFWQKELPPGEMKTMLVEDSYKPALEFYRVADEEKGEKDKAAAAFARLDSSYENHRKQIDRLTAFSAKDTAQDEKDTAAYLGRSTWLMAVIGILMTLAIAFVNLYILRAVTASFRYCREIVTRLSEGDLTADVKVSGNGGVRSMLESLATLTVNLRRMIGRMVEESTNIAVSVSQISIDSRRIARDSAQVAGSSEQVARSSEEMAATSADVAGNCEQAAVNSRAIGEVAADGYGLLQTTIERMETTRHEMEQTLQVIGKLGHSSERIGQIADMIQDIADQTNLLALNAAIEAARAGDQGRGFAVVADEVRALAERTTKATREIGEMIKTIQSETGQAVSAMQRSAEDVESGARGAEESGAALMRITGQLDEISTEIGQIATATQQQSISTNEVAENITGISTSAAVFLESAHSMAEKLEQLVAVSEEMKKTAETFSIPTNDLTMLNTAKIDHLAFVGRIERCLDGTESVQADKLPDHTCCRFGKWYFDEGQELCARSTSFKSINPPHEEFHKAAREAVELHGRGDIGEAFQRLMHAQELSSRIVDLLDRVQEECDVAQAA